MNTGVVLVCSFGYGLSCALFGIGAYGLAAAWFGSSEPKEGSKLGTAGIGFMLFGFSICAATAKLTGAI